MGISIGLLEQILINKEIFRNRDVLSISVQYPPNFRNIQKLNKKMGYVLNDTQMKILRDSNNNQFSKVLFEQILNSKSFSSIDISNEEGADYIANLNEEITDDKIDLCNKFDCIIEGGTMEHLSNNQQYLNNILSLLKIGGNFFCSTPTSGYSEHGFYQFSPTFIADLNFNNNKLIKLNFLGLEINSQKTKGLLLNKFYKNNFFENCIADNELKNYPSIKKNYVESNLLTGTLMKLVFSSNYKIMLLFTFEKLDNQKLNFNFNQYIYKYFSLEKLSGSKSKNAINKSFKLSLPLLRDIFVSVPFSNKIKYNFLIFLLRLLFIFRKTQSQQS